jgi:predicted DNA-binding transcriptional regulator AlpA
MSTALNHPPAFVSRKTLAAELDIAESTVDDFVKRGILPAPITLSKGCVRWSWGEVETAVLSRRPDPLQAANDPFMAGAASVTDIKERRREAA